MPKSRWVANVKIIVDLLFGNAQQVCQRCPPKPVFGNVQLAGRLAQAGDDQHGSDAGPSNLFALGTQQTVQEFFQAQGLPEPPAQPDIAKAPAACTLSVASSLTLD
jgi:hypothetical protein